MSKYKTGDKFEIEIERVLQGALGNGKSLYKIKGMNTLTFDDYGLGLLKKIEEPENKIDWSKVPVDTPIYVRGYKDAEWGPRYFAKYEDGRVHAWACGTTSFTALRKGNTTTWPCAKLAEDTNERD